MNVGKNWLKKTVDKIEHENVQEILAKVEEEEIKEDDFDMEIYLDIAAEQRDQESAQKDREKQLAEESDYPYWEDDF